MILKSICVFLWIAPHWVISFSSGLHFMFPFISSFKRCTTGFTVNGLSKIWMPLVTSAIDAFIETFCSWWVQSFVTLFSPTRGQKMENHLFISSGWPDYQVIFTLAGFTDRKFSLLLWGMLALIVALNLLHCWTELYQTWHSYETVAF